MFAKTHLYCNLLLFFCTFFCSKHILIFEDKKQLTRSTEQLKIFNIFTYEMDLESAEKGKKGKTFLRNMLRADFEKIEKLAKKCYRKIVLKNEECVRLIQEIDYLNINYLYVYNFWENIVQYWFEPYMKMENFKERIDLISSLRIDIINAKFAVAVINFISKTTKIQHYLINNGNISLHWGQTAIIPPDESIFNEDTESLKFKKIEIILYYNFFWKIQCFDSEADSKTFKDNIILLLKLAFDKRFSNISVLCEENDQDVSLRLMFDQLECSKISHLEIATFKSFVKFLDGLPQDTFENISSLEFRTRESIFFDKNILSYLKGKDIWRIVNEFTYHHEQINYHYEPSCLPKNIVITRMLITEGNFMWFDTAEQLQSIQFFNCKYYENFETIMMKYPSAFKKISAIDLILSELQHSAVDLLLQSYDTTSILKKLYVVVKEVQWRIIVSFLSNVYIRKNLTNLEFHSLTLRDTIFDGIKNLEQLVELRLTNSHYDKQLNALFNGPIQTSLKTFYLSFDSDYDIPFEISLLEEFTALECFYIQPISRLDLIFPRSKQTLLPSLKTVGINLGLGNIFSEQFLEGLTKIKTLILSNIVFKGEIRHVALFLNNICAKNEIEEIFIKSPKEKNISLQLCTSISRFSRLRKLDIIHRAKFTRKFIEALFKKAAYASTLNELNFRCNHCFSHLHPHISKFSNLCVLRLFVFDCSSQNELFKNPNTPPIGFKKLKLFKLENYKYSSYASKELRKMEEKFKLMHCI